MNILISHCRLPYPLYYSGADKATMELAEVLQLKGHRVTLLFCTGDLPKNNIKGRFKEAGIAYKEVVEGYVYQYGLLTCRLLHPDCFFDEYSRCLKQDSATVVLHHSNIFESQQLDQQWEQLFNLKATHIGMLHSVEGMDRFSVVKDKCAALVCNSDYLAQCVIKQWGKSAIVALPVPGTACIAKKKHNKAVYHTFFNPVKSKGSELMAQLILGNPDRFFMVVLGWDLKMEWELDVKTQKNVMVIPPQQQVDEIYSFSKMVLIPSQEPEAFGRVQFEAAMNNIPCCVSNQGGLKNYYSDNGVLVKDYTHYQAWQDAIYTLDNPQNYGEAIKSCKRLATSYSLEQEVAYLEIQLEKLLK